jgi:hypothetical protein
VARRRIRPRHRRWAARRRDRAVTGEFYRCPPERLPPESSKWTARRLPGRQPAELGSELRAALTLSDITVLTVLTVLADPFNASGELVKFVR